jgi:hypothetical protein
MILTDVPAELAGRGIAPAAQSGGFALMLDVAEPWGGGVVAGRVERRGERSDNRPLTVTLTCEASWLDLAPQLVGEKRLLSLDTLWDLRARALPIWLAEDVLALRAEAGALVEANWQPFRFELPPQAPRAFEGTFVAFRWRLRARRRRAIGHVETSLPLVVREERTLPVVRAETSPLGSWRLLDWKAEGERDGAGGSCSVRYEDRRPEDAEEKSRTSSSIIEVPAHAHRGEIR